MERRNAVVGRAALFGARRPAWFFRIVQWIPAVAFIGLFFYYPLAAVLRLGVEAVLQGEADALPLGSAFRVLGFTVFQAALSMLLTLAVGLPGAYLFARYDFPLKRFLRAFSIVPFILPTVVVAAGFESLLGPRGWINLALQQTGWIGRPIPFLHTLGAILLAHVFYNTSIVLRTVGAAWERLDPRLGDAARVLGAGRRQAFRRVTLPLLMPSILAAASLVFLFDFTSFGVILILGGPSFSTLEVEIYIQALQALNLPAAALLSILQILCSLTLIAVSGRLARRMEAASARVGIRAARKPASTAEWILAASILAALAALFLAPLASPAARSLLRMDAGLGERSGVRAEWTLEYYRELFYNRRGTAFFATPLEMAGNSLLAAAATAAFALAFGIPAAALLSRPTRIDRALEPLLLLPLGTSAVTLGLGMLIVFSRPPWNWIRSPAMIPVAHTLVAFPFVVRGLKPAFAGIPERLREAAAVLGASPWMVWRTVVFPIALRAVLSSAAFAFAVSLGEFGATSIIVRPDFPTMPVGIYRLLSQPGGLNYGQAMAMTTLLMLFCAAAVMFIEWEHQPAKPA
ncbi:MAG: iron ABC transporter permease [Anaerolineales bacterium]|nr:iron ABC transporter permease [Anaerolineales bacterium]